METEEPCPYCRTSEEKWSCYSCYGRGTMRAVREVEEDDQQYRLGCMNEELAMLSRQIADSHVPLFWRLKLILCYFLGFHTHFTYKDDTYEEFRSIRSHNDGYGWDADWFIIGAKWWDFRIEREHDSDCYL